ncbi:unnamed protein product [Alternaria alternata]
MSSNRGVIVTHAPRKSQQNTPLLEDLGDNGGSTPSQEHSQRRPRDIAPEIKVSQSSSNKIHEKNYKVARKMPSARRRLSSLITPAQLVDQQRLIEFEKAQIRSEEVIAEARERDEQLAAILKSQQEKPGYWDPRSGDRRLSPSITTRQLGRPSVTRPMSYSGEPGPQYHWPEQPKSGRRQEESERQTAEDAAKAEREKERHVRFELGRAENQRLFGTTAEPKALPSSRDPFHEQIHEVAEITPINPPVPTGSGAYLVQARRPSRSSSRPSIRDGQRPEIIIEFGSKKDKTKKYPSISVSSKPFNREQPVAQNAKTAMTIPRARSGAPPPPLPPPRHIDLSGRDPGWQWNGEATGSSSREPSADMFSPAREPSVMENTQTAAEEVNNELPERPVAPIKSTLRKVHERKDDQASHSPTGSSFTPTNLQYAVSAQAPDTLSPSGYAADPSATDKHNAIMGTMFPDGIDATDAARGEHDISEDPEFVREGVAPHKDAFKGKDIPVGAQWTRIDRRLVNPEALEEAKERFEERIDCVMVLRVLTREEIQKLANRTKRIRERREVTHEAREPESIAIDTDNNAELGADKTYTTPGSSKKPFVSESERDSQPQTHSNFLSALSRPSAMELSSNDSSFGDLHHNYGDFHGLPEVPGELLQDSDLSRIDHTYDKLHEERVNSIHAEGNATTPHTEEANVQQSSNWFQPVVEERLLRDEEELTAAEEAEASSGQDSFGLGLDKRKENKGITTQRSKREAKEKKESEEKEQLEGEAREAAKIAQVAKDQHRNQIFKQATAEVLAQFNRSTPQEDSSDEEERERIYLKKKKRWSAGIFKRSHSQSQSAEVDNSYADIHDLLCDLCSLPFFQCIHGIPQVQHVAARTFYNDPNNVPIYDLDQNARRLRRRIRGPRKGSIVFEDRSVEELDEGTKVPHWKGPPSITNDDYFTLDELPFWKEQNMIDVKSESELESESEHNVAGKQENLRRNPISQERLVEHEPPAAVRAPETGQLDVTASTNGDRKKTDEGTTSNVLMEFEQPLLVHTRSSINSWLKATLADENNNKNIEWDYNDSTSGPSSYAASVASVFSVTSLASSASDISKGSGYSAIQIATATKVLLSIFYEDEVLLSLYKRAIEAQNIGPERLQRNLRRLFRAYAGLLEGEATERLEHLASRLVRAKSASLAKSIIEKLQIVPASTELSPSERNNESSDEEDDGASSRPVNEDVFEDLVTFRQFLIESEAFKTFHNQLQAFVIPNLAPADRTETVTKEALGCDEEGIVKHDVLRSPAQSKTMSTWHEWFRDVSQALSMSCSEIFALFLIATGFHLNLDTLLFTRDHLLVNMGLLEPALDQNKTRLRWRCNCGDSIYSDMMELREGGIAELVDRMQRSSGVKVHAAPHNRQSGNQQYIVPRPDRWLRNATTKVGTAFGGSSKSSPSCLPQHNSPYATTSCSTSTNPSTTKKILHLSMCMHRTRRRKIVKQDRVDEITTDRTLLRFLQRQYATHRGRFLNIARLKTVQRIVFVKFRLPMGGSVDVQHHLYCIADPANWKYCECTPPPNKVGVEYEYSPSPPKTHPPIPPEYLASLFTCATDVHEEDDWILNQLPKRTCGVLQGQKGQPAEGWGIYFLEGWDREIISLLILFIFFLASLLFGVLWWKFQFDLQGGFGVSAYMMAVCTIVISVVVTRLENKG